jgi:hypothetical protein
LTKTQDKRKVRSLAPSLSRGLAARSLTSLV